MPLSVAQKIPEALVDLRVDGWARSLPVSAAIVTAIVMSPTAVATVLIVTAIIAVAISRTATRGDVNHRLARCRSVNDARRAIRHRRRAINDWRRTTRCGDHDRRCVIDRSREGNAHRPTRLRRGGEPSESNHCNQTEEMFCFHARFDGLFPGFFRESKILQTAVGQSVIEEVS